MSLFLWKIQVQVAECQGIAHQSLAEYSLLLRLGDQFSAASPSGHPHSSSSKISFNHTLKLHLTTPTPQLPNNQLQIILVMAHRVSANGHVDILQEIIGIATVTVFYPLQEYLEGFRMFRFDKSLDSKGTVKARIKITKQQQVPTPKTPKQRSPTKLRPKTASMSNSSSSHQSEQEKPSKSLTKPKVSSADKYKQLVESLTQQRNELYKMSEELYSQLQRCIDQRDEYLRELRQKVLSEDMLRAQMQFLKLKVNEHQEIHHNSLNMSHSYDQIDDLRKYNEDLLGMIEQKDKAIKELERQVKESLVALNEFKKQALNARSELLHKQSQLSMLSQQTKTIEPQQCIQELYKQLEDRKYQHPFDFQRFYQREPFPQQIVEQVKKQIAALFHQLIGKIKVPSDKQWLLKEKLRLDRFLEEALANSLINHNK